MEGVTGSIPVAPTISFSNIKHPFGLTAADGSERQIFGGEQAEGQGPAQGEAADIIRCCKTCTG